MAEEISLQECSEIRLNVAALDVAASQLAQGLSAQGAANATALDASWREVAKHARRLWDLPDRSASDLGVWNSWPDHAEILVRAVVSLLDTAATALLGESEETNAVAVSKGMALLTALLTTLPLRDDVQVARTLQRVSVACHRQLQGVSPDKEVLTDAIDSAMLMLAEETLSAHVCDDAFIDGCLCDVLSLGNCQQLLDRRSTCALHRSIFHSACRILRNSAQRLEKVTAAGHAGLEKLAARLWELPPWRGQACHYDCYFVLSMDALQTLVQLGRWEPREKGAERGTLVQESLVMHLVVFLWKVLGDLETHRSETCFDGWRFSFSAVQLLAALAARAPSLVQGSGAVLVLHHLSTLRESEANLSKAASKALSAMV